VNAQKPRVAELLEQLVGWKNLRLFPGIQVGLDVLFDEL
jgi:hypothetical protein